MIWESAYWKDDLLKQAEFLRQKQRQRRWTERSLAKVEQTVMIGFYSIRKLADAIKVSSAVMARQIRVRQFLALEKPVTLLNWHHIDELYDLRKGQAVFLSLKDLCNQFIHSYCFIVSFNEQGRFNGVFVCSDHSRKRRLYYVSARAIIGVMRNVGRHYPDRMTMTYNRNKEDYDVS